MWSLRPCWYSFQIFLTRIPPPPSSPPLLYETLSVMILSRFPVATYGFDSPEYRVAEGSELEVRVVGTHVTAQTLLFSMDTIPGTANGK